jgi:hypothetical protein
MSYLIIRSDPSKTPITVNDGTVNSAPLLSVGLVGRNTIDYGQPIATSQVHMLENFADSAPPVNPIPGQLWYDNANKLLHVNTGTTDGDNTWTPIVSSSVPVQEADPALDGLSNIAPSPIPAIPDSLVMSTGNNSFVYLPVTLFAQGLLNDPDAATMRTTLGLGNAATRTVQTNDLDTTDGRVLTVGAFGLGVFGAQPAWPNTSINNCSGVGSGSYATIATNTDLPNVGGVQYTKQCLLEFRVRSTLTGDVEYFQQITDVDQNQMAFRVSNGAGTSAAPIWGTWTNMLGTGGGGGGVYQPLDNTLTGLSALTTAANQVIYSTGVDTFTTGAAGTTGKVVMAADTPAAARTTLELANSATILATTAATANTIVLRDNSGNVSISGITGNAATATALQTARTINSVPFDGTANITILDSTKLPINGSSPMTGKLTVSYNGGSTPIYNSGQIELNSGGTNPVSIGFQRIGASACSLVHVGNGLELKGNDWSNRGNFSCAALNVQGTIVASGDITAFSDARLKTNVSVIENPLEKINKLQGVTYDRIDTGKRETGLIAQEVQRVLPEAVHASDDENQTLSLAYGNLAGLFVEAFKEMSDTIAALQAEVAELKARQ